MASQSLYRKWRSQNFDEMVGQEAVIRTLKNALSSGKLAHAYLFTGPRGTGKTTTARLLAKTINCLQPQNGEPCNNCTQCREITAGTSFDVIEIDAASNRGIDNIRDLREQVQRRPASARYKVYVLDEAHMLTTEAFNALLKTLEEPPPYAIFVLATTDVHKLLPTVLSRCQRFDFKRFTMRQLIEHLNYVASQEQITLEKGAAELIARAAAGGMRDALSLLDQAIAYAGITISLAQVQTMLGVADPRAIQTLLLHVADGTSGAGLHLINQLSEDGADLRQVNAQLLEYWRSLMLSRAGANIAEILDLTDSEVHEITQVAQRFGLEELTECARICSQNELLQKNQGTPQLALELAFLACVEVHQRAQAGLPSVRVAEAVVAPAQLKAPIASYQAAAPTEASPSRTQARVPVSPPPQEAAFVEAPTRPAATSRIPDLTMDEPPQTPEIEIELPPLPPARPVAAQPPSAPAARTREAAPASTPAASRPPVASAPAPAAPETTPAVTLTLKQVEAVWEKVKRRVSQRDRKVGSSLNDFIPTTVEPGTDAPVLVLQAQHQPLYQYVSTQNRHIPVEWALNLEFGFKCRVRLLAPKQPNGTRRPRPGGSGTTSSQQTSSSGYELESEPPELPPYDDYAGYPEMSGPSFSATGPVSLPIAAANAASASLYLPEPDLEPSFMSTPEPPLARMDIVRENRVKPTSLPPALREKASKDPRVEEVVRIFGAKIVDIYPK